MPLSARASALVALEIYRDCLGEVRVEVSYFFLSQRLSRDNCKAHIRQESRLKRGRLTFKGLFDVDSFFCARFEVRDAALGLAIGHGALLRDLVAD